MEFERMVKFYPAFDKRNPEPSKNYGVHGVDLLMVVKGDKGAVQFKLFTNWMLPHVVEERMNKPMFDDMDIKCFYMPQPADLGYHSYKPVYEGQTPITKSCELLDGKPCYYDGSGLNAERIYKVLLEKGSDGVWQELEDYYREVFEE